MSITMDKDDTSLVLVPFALGLVVFDDGLSNKIPKVFVSAINQFWWMGESLFKLLVDLEIPMFVKSTFYSW